MKILSVIIAHPHRKVSGATNAGRELSIATAKLVPLDLAIMWDADDELVMEGLGVRHMRCFSRAGAMERLLPRYLRVPLYDSRIPELICEKRYDLVHIHNLVPTFAAERVARTCRRLGIPYVISSHGFVELSHYAKINGFGSLKTALAEIAIAAPFRRIVRGAASIFALSNCEAPLLRELGIPERRIHLVTNGVNEYYLQPPAEIEISECRRKFNIVNKPLLLFMGSLHRYKGADIFLRALASVNQPFQAVLAGSFKNREEPVQLLRTAGVSDEIASKVIFTGRVSDAELRALYHLADLFVYPTQGDTLPLVVLEAMACGTPVISTRVGGIPCMLEGESGMVAPPGAVQPISICVNSLLDAPERRRRMGMAARKRVERIYRWSIAARCAADAYQEVMESSKQLLVTEGQSNERL
jgi:alpha-maltose-1-phosphate synthase